MAYKHFKWLTVYQREPQFKELLNREPNPRYIKREKADGTFDTVVVPSVPRPSRAPYYPNTTTQLIAWWLAWHADDKGNIPYTQAEIAGALHLDRSVVARAVKALRNECEPAFLEPFERNHAMRLGPHFDRPNRWAPDNPALYTPYEDLEAAPRSRQSLGRRYGKRKPGRRQPAAPSQF